MIFVTVGTQEPFDRLIEIMDQMAATIDEEIIAQTFKGEYIPKNMKTVEFLTPDKFNELFTQARIIIAHAGMGTIISALQASKPIIIFPRIAALGEHRNEHQLATAKKMGELNYVYVANKEEELKELIQNSDKLEVLKELGNEASPELIRGIKSLINKKN